MLLPQVLALLHRFHYLRAERGKARLQHRMLVRDLDLPRRCEENEQRVLFVLAAVLLFVLQEVLMQEP